MTLAYVGIVLFLVFGAAEIFGCCKDQRQKDLEEKQELERWLEDHPEARQEDIKMSAFDDLNFIIGLRRADLAGRRVYIDTLIQQRKDRDEEEREAKKRAERNNRRK